MIHTIKTGNSEGITGLFLGLWLIGELATLVYVIPMGSAPLLLNYGINIIATGVIAYYKMRPRT